MACVTTEDAKKADALRYLRAGYFGRQHFADLHRPSRVLGLVDCIDRLCLGRYSGGALEVFYAQRLTVYITLGVCVF